MSKGFTLVELAIVLVIIGLLVSGILIAQSIIDSTRIQRFVREFEQYESAVDHFEQRYRDLPGDTDLFPVSVRGSAVADDDIIGDNLNTYVWFTSEVAHFWKHLSQANILDETYSEDATSGMRAGEHMPEIVYEGVGLFPHSFVTAGKLVFFVYDFSATTNASYGATYLPSFTPATLYAIDLKLDDGVAMSALNAASVDRVSSADATGNCWRVTGVYPKEYNVTEEDKVCIAYMRAR